MKLRRHANRRWFELDRGNHVDLAEVAKAVRRGESVEARDAKDNDLTAELLVAVLAREVGAGRIPPRDELARLIVACRVPKPEPEKPRDVLDQLDDLLDDTES